jgi:hypothetical protein
MKALKILGFVLGGILVLLAVLVGVALLPSVQTWAVRKAVADIPGLQLEVSRVSAGLSAAEISDLRVVRDGTVITAKSVTARYAALEYLTSKRLNADALTVQDLVVDLRNAQPDPAAAGGASPATPPPAAAKKAPAPAPPAGKSPGAGTPFEGALKAAQLPFELRVGTAAIQGRAFVTKEQTATFDLKASGLATGARGKIEWTVDFADATPNAALRGLRATGQAQVQIARDGRIDLVEVDTIAAALGPQLPSDRLQVVAKVAQPAAGGNESYLASLALLRGFASETLLKTEAQFLAASREISGAWDLAIRSEQLAAVLAGLGLPELAANGSGKFTFKPATNAVSATGAIQGAAAKLDKVAPALAAIGSVRFKVAFDGGLAGNQAQLNQLALEATSADGRKFAEVATAQRVGYDLAAKRVTFADAKAELARVQVTQLPLAWAQPVLQGMTIAGGDLSLALAVEAEPDGSRVRARTLSPLTLREVTLKEKDKAVVDRVTLSVRPSVDYSSTRVVAGLDDLSISTPGGDAVTGKLAAEVTALDTPQPVVAYSSNLQAKIVSLLKPFVPIETGPLTIVTTTEGRLQGDRLDIAKAGTTVTRDAGALLVAVEAQQPIRVDLNTTSVAAANPQAPAARVKLGEIPLAWAEPYVANSKFAGALAGGLLDVTLRSLEDFTLVTTEPVTLRGVTVALDGKPTLHALDVSANLTATKRGHTVAYEVRRLEVKQGPALLAGLSVAGEAKLGAAKPIVAAKGNLEADVPALLRQPALVPFATLSSGRVAATFDATVADAIQAKASLTARTLVAKADNRALGDLEINLDATMKPDGSGNISAPLTLTQAARKSDLTIVGAFGKSSDQKTFLLTGKISSNNLVVDDFQPLAGLAPAGEPAKPAVAATPAPRPTPAPAPRPGTSTGTSPRPGGTTAAGPIATAPSAGRRDTAPFWQGVNGKIEVDLKRILYGKDYVISPVRGTAVITDTRLSLDGLEGRFKQNPFKLSGGVTFAPQLPKPYSLTAAADVQNLDIGEILRAAAPNEKPVFETKASLNAQLAGTGANLVDLGKNAYGKFSFTGTEGITRLLARSEKASTIANVATLGLAILGAKNNSQGLTAAAELTQLLNEVRFDSVKVQVERAADLSFKLTAIEIVSPILRTSGTGTLASKSTDDIANAPMNIVLQLGAKGALAHALNQGRLLSGQTDDKGYYLMSKTFTIGGTPAKPDRSALWAILLETGLGSFLR